MTINLTRSEAEARLKSIFGLDHFYDEQWKVIDALLHGKRILMIERTGFGKSLCYQFPATQFQGVTIVFSPLIALMRDQVKALQSHGIAARCINSEQELEENQQVIEDALQGKLKILYIAPERQNSEVWQDVLRSGKMKIAMVVVDEAHTVSQWGHDFRPAFRRIKNLVNKYLPVGMPILATTATATKRVQHDIEMQLGNLSTIRGSLMRPNFRLHVVKVQSEDDKLIWLKQNLNKFSGTGIVYTGTRVMSEYYTRWLQENGINAIEYHAGLMAEARKDIEQGLMENRWKCVVSTNALGMGIDKNDLRFIIHVQMPASPIHYYQEIGRAGRDGLPTDAVLLFNEHRDENGEIEDLKLPKAFIDNARPSKKKYLKAIEAIRNDLLGEQALMKATNLKQTAIRVIKEDLLEQGIIKEVVINRYKKYEYQFNAPALNYDYFEQLNEAKRVDLKCMYDYVYTTMPRMKYLCDYLGDEENYNYSCTCENTGLPQMPLYATDADRIRLANFKTDFFPELKFYRCGNLTKGVAASYYGITSVGHTLHHCKYEGGGDFPESLIRQTLHAYHKKLEGTAFDMIVYVPPTTSGDLVRNFAHTIGRALGIPVSDGLKKTRVTNPQKVYQQAPGKAENVKDAFTFEPAALLQGKNILLIDDIYDSGATIKEIGRCLTKLGAQEINALVIAKTVGGDNI